MQSLCYFSAHQRAYSPFPMPRQAAGVFIHKLEKKKKSRSQTAKNKMQTGSIQLFQFQFTCRKPWSALRSEGCAWQIDPEAIPLGPKIQSSNHKKFLSSLFSHSAVSAPLLRGSFIKPLLCSLLQVWIWTAPCTSPTVCPPLHFLSLRCSVTSVVKYDTEEGSYEWKHNKIWPPHPSS